MFRSRLMSFVVAASLLASCGCCICWPERPWFGRRCCNNGCSNNGGCCNGSGELTFSDGDTLSSQGPILTDGEPPLYQGPQPQMAPMPRLAPTPAQPFPYSPINRTSLDVEDDAAQVSGKKAD